MYRERQHDQYSDEELARIYTTPHRHDLWIDHEARVQLTIELAQGCLPGDALVADLSCGDGVIARALCENPILGDFAPGYDICGPIESTISQIPEVDVFVCCETLEHVDDPDTLLKDIRKKSQYLVLSTPNCDGPDGNPEHLWVWDAEAVRLMLGCASWKPMRYAESYIGYGYRFQIWICE